MKETISLKCFNPQGVFKIQEPAGLSPRVDSLKGKTIGVFWDGKAGGDNFCIAVEEHLNQRFPTAKTIRLGWNDVGKIEKAKEEVDTFISAVGDSGAAGWIWTTQVIAMEKIGKPGALVMADVALWNAKISAKEHGMPPMRIVCMPSIEYFPNRGTVEEVRPVVEAYIDEIIESLTKPLTEEEKYPKREKEQEARAFVEIKADSYESAIEKFNQLYLDNHWGDGLPLIPPTEEAVEEMLTGTSRSPNEVIGLVPFRKGAATIEKIAINAVMAGAKPEYLPVIIAAIEGLTDETYALPDYSITPFSHMLSSEGSFNMMIMVSGPIGKEIDMNCGVGLLAHCNQANNSIGRAVELCVINLGYTWPGEIDMALIGRSSSHTFYTFAENIEDSPWESFDEGLGYKPDDSYVTVSTVAGMTLFGGGTVGPWSVQSALDNMVRNLSTNRMGMSKHVLVICPELAIVLKRNGFETKQSLRDYLYENTKVPYEEITNREMQRIEESINLKPGGLYYYERAADKSFVPKIKEALKPGGKVPMVNPDDIHIVVAGSVPGYSFGMRYFHTAHQTKQIKGAALTKSGK
ncbi:MAG TPA: hypothetical protein G4O15_13735 [Dehalococcoidia bacterium]|nr:hypothetical protein [Dehalococcoidia bacterium]